MWLRNSPDLDEDRRQLIADEIDQIHKDLIEAIYAVGSMDKEADTSSETRSSFSNYGCWVNAAAYGRDQIGEYPSADPGVYVAPTLPPEGASDQDADPTYAKWSGTSFADGELHRRPRHRLLRQRRHGNPPGDGRARNLPDGLDCPQTTPTTTTAP